MTPTSPTPSPTAALIIIGNEILSGRTQDTNARHLAERLGRAGIRLREIRVVPDETEAIVAAVNALRPRVDHVFTTGGIGPTHDDITAAALATAFGVPLIRHPDAVAILTDHYGDALTEARLKMAETPEGAALIDNPVSAAPGFRMGNVHVLAGVPAIMRAMLESLLPGLNGGPPLLSRSVTAPAREGELAAPLAAIQARWPRADLGSYPWARGGRIGTTLVVRGTDAAMLDSVIAEVAALLRAQGHDPEIGERSGGDQSS
ncbi:competence/damage-inducible protein A [Roseospira visakhapatnamensis]|uniref:Molybdenum cofactor synthesis domain-containing protein n=1 Tax=Roseospira visakhapatnamensis TaxID=390880 RepID=A0A7W6WC18_9PROT|nr:molybdopterin-binding protein [Roseospira visakhapatnamensis]MBB4268142.1 molybdenum cofactor synthesis domain-containing protein [Roseospira visakhapatnamensis]